MRQICFNHNPYLDQSVVQFAHSAMKQKIKIIYGDALDNETTERLRFRNS